MPNGRFSVAADIKRGWSCHVVFLCAIDLPCRCAVAELVLLFEIGVWPPHDGVSWSRDIGAVAKMDRMTEEVIRNEETKAPFARVQSQGCA